MCRDLGLTKRDWDRTPQAVCTLWLALQQQVRLMSIRFTAYEKQLASLRAEVAQVDDLKAEIQELRERLSQYSSNSSRPPSSDPPSCKSKPPRQATSRKRGAQPAQQGHMRQLVPVEGVSHVIDLKPQRCRRCGRGLRGSDSRPERYQVAEVPPVRVEVTQYRRHRLCCSACGAVTQADWS